MSVFVVGGAAAGLTAAVAIPTVVGVSGAAAMAAGGAAIGSMLGGRRGGAPASQSAGVQYNTETLYDSCSRKVILRLRAHYTTVKQMSTTVDLPMQG